MPSVSTVPTRAPKGKDVQVIFSLAQPTANYVRVWCTVAPDGSSLANDLIKNASSRIKVYEGKGGKDEPWRVKFDKGGKYTLVAQEYAKGTGFGGGFKGDPDGFEKESQLGVELTLSLHIGQRLEQKIGVDADIAKLVVWLWDDTIVPTDVHTYGEATPAIVSQSPTDKARAAMNSAAVQSALLNLQGQNISAEESAVCSLIANLFLIFGITHAQSPTFHANADSYNSPALEQLSVPTRNEWVQTVSSMLVKMRRHYTNDGGTGIGSANLSGTPTPYHKSGGIGVSDYANIPLFRGVSSPEDLYSAFADCWRAHDGHRRNAGVHTVADPTAANPLTAILEVHRQFMTVLSQTSSPAPPGQSSGAAALVRVGFKET